MQVQPPADGISAVRHQLGLVVFRFQVSELSVQGSGFRFQVSGFRFRGSGFKVQGSGLRSYELGFAAFVRSPCAK
jgi:hypothetical protein